MSDVYGRLYVISTPIGNLEDITVRALNVLKDLDFCLAEDTRHTKKLFSRYEIKTQLLSCHRHNEKSRVNYVIEQIENGKKVGLVSDAGTPGVSDPGERLIREIISRELPIEIIPGACSPIVALCLSGMRMDRFNFEGFVPRKGNKRNKLLKRIATENNTTILFESPLRLHSLMKDLLKYCGDRKVAVCRELTKLYEETIRENISQILDSLSNNKIKIKGEMVIVVEGGESYKKRNSGENNGEQVQ